MTTPTALSIVIVVDEGGLDGLVLTARSIKRYVADDVASEVVLLDASKQQPDFRFRIEARAFPELGNLTERTRILTVADHASTDHRDEAGALPSLLASNSGSDSTYTLTIDTRHHLIAPLTFDTLSAPNGAGRADTVVDRRSTTESPASLRIDTAVFDLNVARDLSATSRFLGDLTGASTRLVRIDAGAIDELSTEGRGLLARHFVDCALAHSESEGLRQVDVMGRRKKAPGDDVLIGRADRLSIGAGTNKLLAQHQGSVTLTAAERAQWSRTIDSRERYCNANGAEYAMLIAPDTYSIFREDFEAFGPDSSNRPVIGILSDLAAERKVVYPLNALRAARRTGIVAHTADSHWTGLGAFIAYQHLTGVLPEVLHRFTDDEIVATNGFGTGDLGDKLTPVAHGEFTEVRVKSPRSRQVWNNGVNNRGYMGLWHQDAPDLPRGVLYMDSYGWKFQRFLAESFSSLLVVHSPFLEREPIERYNPDVVINLMAERFLIRVPDDDTQEPALVTARTKSPSAAYPSSTEYLTGVVSDGEPETAAASSDTHSPPIAPTELQRLIDAEAEIVSLRSEITRLRGWISEQKESLRERGQKIEDLRSWVSSLRRRISDLEGDSTTKE